MFLSFRLSLLLSIVSLIIGCSSQSNSVDTIPMIDYSSEYFLEAEDVLFDTLFDKCEFVILETSDKSLINRIYGLTVTDKEILIIDQGVVKVFDREGIYICQMGAEGRGPGEYMNPLNVVYNKESGIYAVYGYMNLVQFNSEKEAIRKVKLGADNKRMHQVNSELYVSELRTEPHFGDSIVYSLEFFNSEIESIYKYPSKDNTEPVEGQFNLLDFMGTVNSGSDGLLFIEAYGDTIYSINDRMELRPELVLNFADEKFPRELHFNMDSWAKERGNYTDLGKFTLSENMLVSSYSFDGKGRYAITDIENNKTISPFTSYKNEYGFVLSGLPGINFRPFFIEGYMAGVIEAADIAAHLDPDSKAITADLKARLQQIDENDNPVIVLGGWE